MEGGEEFLATFAVTYVRSERMGDAVDAPAEPRFLMGQEIGSPDKPHRRDEFVHRESAAEGKVSERKHRERDNSINHLFQLGILPFFGEGAIAHENDESYLKHREDVEVNAVEVEKSEYRSDCAHEPT